MMDDLALLEFLPNVQELFKIYNEKYFENCLIDVTLDWSDRMTSCAGICMLRPDRKVLIRLSRPLLQLRPFSDTIDTLIHEMIHAYFFVRQGGSIDRDGHGSDFCAIMHNINNIEGTHITIYHSFHDEVNHYKKHIWRCNGQCRLKPPYFGWVKRAMNRKPQPADSWWPAHQNSCDGTFIKISEPDNKIILKGKNKDKDKSKSLIDIGIKVNVDTTKTTETKVESHPLSQSFQGKGRTWSESNSSESSAGFKNIKITNFFSKNDSKSVLNCVNCSSYKTESLKDLNEHLDICLHKIFINLADDE